MASGITLVIEVIVGIFLVGIFFVLFLKYTSVDTLKQVSVQTYKEVQTQALYYGSKYEFQQYETRNVSKKNTFATEIPVLVYHGITLDGYKNDVLMSDFKDQMFALKKAGYTTVTLQQFEEFMRGERNLPDKSFLLTFDDGIKTSFYNTDPILQLLNYTAVIFIISKYSFLDRHKYYLTKNELRHMLDSGRWEMQAHARDGHNLMLIDPHGTRGNFVANLRWVENESRYETPMEHRERVRIEFVETKHEIETALKIPIHAFAFPFGNFGQDSKNYPEAERIVWEEAKKVYDYSYYQWIPTDGFSVNYPNPAIHTIKRIIIYKGTSGEKILDLVEDARLKEMPYTDEFVKNAGFITVWGNATFTNGTVILQPFNTSPGSFSFLAGTYLWKDYQYTLFIKNRSAQAIGLVSYFQDQENYLTCEFLPDRMRLKQIRANQTYVLGTISNKKTAYVLPDENFSVGMSVQNTGVTCFVDKKPLLFIEKEDIDSLQGGIGFRFVLSQNRTGRRGQIIIDALNVTPVGFRDSFEQETLMEETASPAMSKSDFWWLNSGGLFLQKKGMSGTIHGALTNEKWKDAYAKANPLDTSNGTYPQNIFRLITKKKWENITQQVYARVDGYRFSDSLHRNEANGILLFSRYYDHNNLYYAGVRVDGNAVIKKKHNGVYYELVRKEIFPGSYDRNASPLLLPLNTWIGLRTVTFTLPDGAVNITLFMDINRTGTWVPVLELVDNTTAESSALSQEGHAGLRTDFMDVMFDDYTIVEI